MKEREVLLLPYVFIAILVLASVIVWTSAFAREGNGKLEVTFLDVGQGDAVFIETPNGTHALIDGGKGRVVLRELSKVMHFSDRSIDVVVATHPDLDHIGGLPQVLERFSVGMFIDSGVEDGGADQQALRGAVEREGLVPVHAQAGMQLVLDEGVTLEILSPRIDATNLEANRGSVVARLVYGETAFLFTGDAPAGVEEYLAIRLKETLQSDVLKLGHHGSKTSTSELLLGFTQPTYAVVSAGCDNSYGHPHSEVLERVAKFEAEVVSTCVEGAVKFVSDGENLTRL